MDAGTTAHDVVVADLNVDTRNFTAHHVVDGTTLHLSWKPRHDDVSSRFEGDVAEVTAAVRLERHDAVWPVLEVGRTVVVEGCVRDRLSGLGVYDGSGY